MPLLARIKCLHTVLAVSVLYLLEHLLTSILMFVFRWTSVAGKYYRKWLSSRTSNALNALVWSEQVRLKQTSETVCTDGEVPNEIWKRVPDFWVGNWKGQTAAINVEPVATQTDSAMHYVSKFVLCFTSYGSYKGFKQQVTFKVIQAFQGHWQWCHSISHIRFPIRLALQSCLYLALFPRYYHLFP